MELTKDDIGKRFITNSGKIAFINAQVDDEFSGTFEGHRHLTYWNEVGQWLGHSENDLSHRLAYWNDINTAPETGEAFLVLTKIGQYIDLRYNKHIGEFSHVSGGGPPFSKKYLVEKGFKWLPIPDPPEDGA
jgi:hypothetical protein